MTSRFLDTTFLVDLLSANRHAVTRAQSLQDSGELLATPAPCVAEVIRGARRVGPTKTAAAEELLEQLEVIPVDMASARHAGMIAAETQDRGGEVAMIDCLIAAVVIEASGILVSRDTDFSHIPGLVLETY